MAEDLSDLLSNQSEGVQREISARPASWALSAVTGSDPRLDAATKALGDREHGPSPVTSNLTALLEELDEIAFDLQDDGNSAACDRARAVHSLLFALHSDAREAVLEASYEALTSREIGTEEYRALVHDWLGS